MEDEPKTWLELPRKDPIKMDAVCAEAPEMNIQDTTAASTSEGSEQDFECIDLAPSPQEQLSDETDTWAQVYLEIERPGHLDCFHQLGMPTSAELESAAHHNMLPPKLQVLLRNISEELYRILDLSKRPVLPLSHHTQSLSSDETWQRDRQALLTTIHSLQDLVSRLTADRDLGELEAHLISKDRNSLLDEIDSLKAKLRDFQQQSQEELLQLQETLRGAQAQGNEQGLQLHSQVEFLEYNLDHGQARANEDLERSQRSNRELQKELRDLKLVLDAQTTDLHLVAESLEDTQQNMKEIQFSLEAKTKKCRLGTQREQELVAALKTLKDQKQELKRALKKERQQSTKLRAGCLQLQLNLETVHARERKREEQRRQDWKTLLKKVGEALKNQNKLVHSLDAVEAVETLGTASCEKQKSSSEESRPASSSSPCVDSGMFHTTSLEEPMHQEPQSLSQLANRFSQSPGDTEDRTITPCEDNEPLLTEYIKHLQIVQQRIKGLQSVQFRNNIEDFLGVDKSKEK
ncbi:pericentrin-like [Polyodon spathula]|uniref:pericentrin-like n=1 Tax=Polyodon spathula TaxID=7913 RepID=UPI001B7F1121|nr:pericentrin-like [Polyodon spathula]